MHLESTSKPGFGLNFSAELESNGTNLKELCSHGVGGMESESRSRFAPVYCTQAHRNDHEGKSTIIPNQFQNGVSLALEQTWSTSASDDVYAGTEALSQR